MRICPHAYPYAADRRAKVLADWQEAINDQGALLRDPAQYVGELTDHAHQAHAQGVIDAEDLRELLEWADAAFSWGEDHSASGN